MSLITRRKFKERWAIIFKDAGGREVVTLEYVIKTYGNDAKNKEMLEGFARQFVKLNKKSNADIRRIKRAEFYRMGYA